MTAIVLVAKDTATAINPRYVQRMTFDPQTGIVIEFAPRGSAAGLITISGGTREEFDTLAEQFSHEWHSSGNDP